MVYKMRFVQNYDKKDEAAFLALEKRFIEVRRKIGGSEKRPQICVRHGAGSGQYHDMGSRV